MAGGAEKGEKIKPGRQGVLALEMEEEVNGDRAEKKGSGTGAEKKKKQKQAKRSQGEGSREKRPQVKEAQTAVPSVSDPVPDSQGRGRAVAECAQAKSTDEETAKGELESTRMGERRKTGPEDIDAIFAEARQHKAERPQRALKAVKQQVSGKRTGTGREKKQKRQEGEEREGFAAMGMSNAGNPKTRRRTEEGYAVYTEAELNWASKKSGGTKLCPFDCDCCF